MTMRRLGWRVFATNKMDLSLTEAVLAYRQEYLVERGFNRMRGKRLGMTSLHLSSTTRIKGVVRLLSIGLRVLCLVEFSVREKLREHEETLSGIYAGNPKRSTARPTTEMILKAFRGIDLTVISFNGDKQYCMASLTPVQVRILALLGFPLILYNGLGGLSER